jgi:hypothetical protein
MTKTPSSSAARRQPLSQYSSTSRTCRTQHGIAQHRCSLILNQSTPSSSFIAQHPSLVNQAGTAPHCAQSHDTAAKTYNATGDATPRASH